MLPPALAAPIMPLGPRRIRVLSAARCIGIGNHVAHELLTTSSPGVPYLQPAGYPGLESHRLGIPCPTDDPGEARPSYGVSDDGTASQLRYLGAGVESFREKDPTESCKALATAKWSEGTVDLWVGYLRALGKSA